jgi:hypothetical protein
MDLEQRREIFRMAAEGKDCGEIHPNLLCEFSNKALKETAVNKWIAPCREQDPKDASKSGRRRNDVIYDTIRRPIDNDPHLSCNGLANILNTSTTTVSRHMTQSMGLTHLATRWIPSNLNSDDRQSRGHCCVR